MISLTSERDGRSGISISLVQSLTTFAHSDQTSLCQDIANEIKYLEATDRNYLLEMGPPEIARMNEQTAILVVDDDKALRTIWSLHLRKLGYDVDLATNGIDAVTMAQSRRYNLILMDIQMPDMDGLAATYAIRKHEAEAQLPPVPIIGVTAGTTNRESCIAAGMDDYLQKPLSGLELKIVVQQWLLCTAT